MGLSHLPDSEFLKPMELNCVEKHLRNSISKKFKNRYLTIGRVAHITEGTKPGLGRIECQHRNRCSRGCPLDPTTAQFHQHFLLLKRHVI